MTNLIRSTYPRPWWLAVDLTLAAGAAVVVAVVLLFF